MERMRDNGKGGGNRERREVRKKNEERQHEHADEKDEEERSLDVDGTHGVHDRAWSNSTQQPRECGIDPLSLAHNLWFYEL